MLESVSDVIFTPHYTCQEKVRRRGFLPALLKNCGLWGNCGFRIKKKLTIRRDCSYALPFGDSGQANLLFNSAIRNPQSRSPKSSIRNRKGRSFRREDFYETHMFPLPSMVAFRCPHAPTQIDKRGRYLGIKLSQRMEVSKP